MNNIFHKKNTKEMPKKMKNKGSLVLWEPKVEGENNDSLRGRWPTVAEEKIFVIV